MATKKTPTKKATKSTATKAKIVSKNAKDALKAQAKATSEEKIVKTPVKGAVPKDTLFSASKQDIISLFATKDGDTGSPEVQVAIATQKILLLSKHLETNPKDNHSRRGLLKIISKRRRILQYLLSRDNDRYQVLIAKLELKK